jgi:hypothetical protein
MHMQLMEELYFVIVDGHFNCGLPQWYHKKRIRLIVMSLLELRK